MAKGLLGKIMSVANDFVQAHIVAANADSAVLTVDLENTGPAGEDAVCEIFFSTSSTPGPLDRVAKAVVIADGGHFELSCKLASPGERVIVKSPTANVAVRVSGIESIPTP